MASPQLLSDVNQFRAACDAVRAGGGRIGFVPTMGALHEGHLALVRRAAERTSLVAVSIFVNPTQFGPNEDFARYPRDVDGDVRKLASVGAGLVLVPEVSAIYPAGEATRVRVSGLTEPLCGRFRPGHFEGVATVVTKLFALAGPCVAVFGKKDYQQLAVIRRLVQDLLLPVEVVGHPIVRERDGLAMSSRNAYLTPEERARARALSRGLADAHAAFGAGERGAGEVLQRARAAIENGLHLGDAGMPSARDVVEYVELTDADALTPFAAAAPLPARALLAVACRVGRTRLIDNVVLGEDPSPLGGRP
jgi:pantoate--beta-alanine ligase